MFANSWGGGSRSMQFFFMGSLRGFPVSTPFLVCVNFKKCISLETDYSVIFDAWLREAAKKTSTNGNKIKKSLNFFFFLNGPAFTPPPLLMALPLVEELFLRLPLHTILCCSL